MFPEDIQHAWNFGDTTINKRHGLCPQGICSGAEGLVVAEL